MPSHLNTTCWYPLKWLDPNPRKADEHPKLQRRQFKEKIGQENVICLFLSYMISYYKAPAQVDFTYFSRLHIAVVFLDLASAKELS